MIRPSSITLAILLLSTGVVVLAEGEMWSSNDDRYPGPSIATGYFTENLGQWNSEFAFIGEIADGHLGLGPGKAYIDIQKLAARGQVHPEVAGGHVVAYRFLDSIGPIPEGSDELVHRSNFLLGNDPDKWIDGARNYRRVTYPGLWQGIDLSYMLTDDGPKYEYLLSPGSDPDDIRVRIDGIEELEIDRHGLIMQVSDDIAIRDTNLLAYYEDDLSHIDISFVLVGEYTYGFELGTYDRDRSIIIDPYLKFTYLGGSVGDRGKAFTLDERGNTYITGSTTSSNFPTTTGAYDLTYNGGFNGDIFVTKINSSFLSLDYSTFIGGTGTDSVASINVRNGEAVITGTTDSSDYPITPNAYNDTNVGWQTIFVTKLNRSGRSLEFSTLVDGARNESGTSLEYDKDGNVIVVGTTSSSDFPTTEGAFDRTINSTSGGLSDTDVVVFKLKGDGTDLMYSTFYGGANWDAATLVGTYDDGSITILGYSASTDLTITTGAYSSSSSGNADLFLARFSKDVSKLERSSYYGGSGIEYGINGIILPNGDVAISGYTFGSVPMMTNAFDGSPNGGVDSFVAKFDRNFTVLRAATYFGGSQDDRDPTIDHDVNGNIFIYGPTLSTDIRTTPGADDSTFNGTNNINMYLAKLDGNLSILMYCTYLGGNGFDYSEDLQVTSPYTVMLTGMISSTDFKVEGKGFDQTKDNGGDGFLLELSLLSPPTPPMFLNYTRGDDWVHLVWEAPFSNGGLPVISYEVWKGPRSGKEILLISLGPDTYDYNDTTIKVDDEFYYYIVANNLIGPSLPSNRIRIADEIPPWLGLDQTPSSAEAGRELTFSTEVFDNAFVSSVHIQYWSDPLHIMNKTMEKDGEGIFSLTISLFDENYEISYSFSLNDTSDNWFDGPVSEVKVRGNILPQFGEDRTPPKVKAGSSIKFSIEAWDNVELNVVMVEFWSKAIYRQNVSMENIVGNLFEYELDTLRYSVAPVEYLFHIKDSSGHWNHTEIRSVDLLDAELPRFGSDSTSREATTGDSFTFTVTIVDNQEINTAWVEYSIDGIQYNGTLVNDFGTVYFFEITVPHIIGRMTYSFFAMDGNGNLAYLPTRQVLILDNDLPELVADLTNGTAFCGGSIIFQADAIDNVAIGRMEVEWWSDEGGYKTAVMSRNVMYELSVEVPISAIRDVSYVLSVFDTSGNMVESDVSVVTMKDMISPSLVKDLTDSSAYAGGEVIFAAIASDNIGVRRISCIWEREDLSPSQVFLEAKDGIFLGMNDLPDDDESPITYRFVIMDTSGNSVETGTRTIAVIDAIKPIIQTVQDMTVSTSTELDIEIAATDNIGVASILLLNSPLPLENGRIKGIIDEPGSYCIVVEATDAAGNTGRMHFVITVAPERNVSESGKVGNPLWIYIPPMIAVLLLIAALLLFFLSGRKKNKTPPLPLLMQEPPQRNDELERLFNSA